MKKVFCTIFILALTITCFSQSEITFYTDSAHVHGFVLLNKEQPFSSQKDLQKTIDSFNLSQSQAWKLPTHDEMRFIFNKTYDKRQLRSSLFYGTYFLSETVKSDQGDFLGYYESTLLGREFTYSPPAYDFIGNLRHRKYLLIRAF